MLLYANPVRGGVDLHQYSAIVVLCLSLFALVLLSLRLTFGGIPAPHRRRTVKVLELYVVVVACCLVHAVHLHMLLQERLDPVRSRAAPSSIPASLSVGGVKHPLRGSGDGLHFNVVPGLSADSISTRKSFRQPSRAVEDELFRKLRSAQQLPSVTVTQLGRPATYGLY